MADSASSASRLGSHGCRTSEVGRTRAQSVHKRFRETSTVFDSDSAAQLIDEGGQPQYDFERALGVLGNLGLVEQRRGRLTVALEIFDRTLAYTREHGSVANLCTLLMRYADAQVDAGQFEEARRSIDEGLDLARRLRMAEELQVATSLNARVVSEGA